MLYPVELRARLYVGLLNYTGANIEAAALAAALSKWLATPKPKSRFD